MITITTYDVMLIIIATLFTIGVLSSIIGIIILVTKSIGKEVSTIAVQTTKLAEKGIAEDIAGLVGNASSLLDAINQLIVNTAGVGVFLTLFGLLMIAAAGILTLQIY
ncbi:MAG: hypothetical protein GYA34_10280 [Chloroflexi bacterium]|nr:hypothetical protein [Chloroflexota bacterium]